MGTKDFKIYAFSMLSATAQMLEFPDSVQEPSDIKPGMEVKIDGKPAPDGDYLMPDTTVIVIRKGKVYKIRPLSKQNVSAMIKGQIKTRKTFI
jgi:hypothetical protein